MTPIINTPQGVQWIQIRPGLSWHVVRFARDLSASTRCGRVASGVVSEERGSGPSCEPCLRWLARQVDG